MTSKTSDFLGIMHDSLTTTGTTTSTTKILLEPITITELNTQPYPFCTTTTAIILGGCALLLYVIYRIYKK